MEAKETLLTRKQISQALKVTAMGYTQTICEAQAEISFKAGMKKVVEYLNIDFSHMGLIEGVPAWIPIDWQGWQAFLKEWGIEEVKEQIK